MSFQRHLHGGKQLVKSKGLLENPDGSQFLGDGQQVGRLF